MRLNDDFRRFVSASTNSVPGGWLFPSPVSISSPADGRSDRI
jgi:hypothetical protein